eukprot:GFUD01009206.1.p1 GENE.GFUD01009206.1~~GFUD01009206.1.p1  ORF type:complete len:117 (+),score=33.16 GFUD01009206.1:349-699(+)
MKMEQKNEVLKGKRQLLNEIDATVVGEVSPTFGQLENERTLREIIKEKTDVQEARPNGNNVAKHQRLKRKHLLELQEKEFSAKEYKIELLIHDNCQLKEIVNRKKNELIQKFQMKD